MTEAHRPDSYVHSRYLGMTLMRWNFVLAGVLFMAALVIFFGFDTPAICYQLTSGFGLLFVANGLMGATSLGSSRGWKASSYAVGGFLAFFGLSSLIRQLSLGYREPHLEGWEGWYPLLMAMALVASIGSVAIFVARQGFKSIEASPR